MTIKAGEMLPDGKLMECTAFESDSGCAMPPKEVNVAEAAKGKTIAVFGVPGAFTPLCSAKHVPSFLQNVDALKAKGLDEIWCVSVNDAFVMAHWGREQQALGKIRFLGDGSAAWARSLGIDADQSARGMGTRMRRFSLLVEDGRIRTVNLEEPGKFEVSDGATLLKQL